MIIFFIQPIFDTGILPSYDYPSSERFHKRQARTTTLLVGKLYSSMLSDRLLNYSETFSTNSVDPDQTIWLCFS